MPTREISTRSLFLILRLILLSIGVAAESNSPIWNGLVLQLTARINTPGSAWQTSAKDPRRHWFEWERNEGAPARNRRVLERCPRGGAGRSDLETDPWLDRIGVQRDTDVHSCPRGQ